jgi:hypothetical protein
MSPLLECSVSELRHRMIGSPLSPKHDILISDQWGKHCKQFLAKVRNHGSKASSGYYYKTHLDYFDKLSRSIASVSGAMKAGGTAVMVVQDSYYKDVHNDLPRIVQEICEISGLKLRRREDFKQARSMARINRYTKTYNRRAEPVESVLCFEKICSPLSTASRQ